LVKLINKKLNRIEEEFRNRNNLLTDTQPVRNCLRAIAKHCLDRVDGIPEEEVLTLDAIVLAIHLLSENGWDFYNSQLWINDINGKNRELIQITVISTISNRYSSNYIDWVKVLFVRDMPTCQAILRQLIEPSLRLPERPYGAKFVHEVLLPFTVAERDLFWSGIHYIPHNHGAKWEGTARDSVFETLTVADDDKWDTAPLLLAWATTNVNNNNRRRIRALIAQWASNKPHELLKLLQITLETNDPQMREDVMLSAYGAACLVRPNEEWLDLCNWLVEFFFTPTNTVRARNAVVRHCASSIIHKCSLCGVAISEEHS
jgi:hypothetical protein